MKGDLPTRQKVFTITGTGDVKKVRRAQRRRKRIFPKGEHEDKRKAFVRDISREQWVESAPSVIKRWRFSRQFTQPGFAEVLGVNLWTVVKWETGENPPPIYLIFALNDLAKHFPID